MNQKGLLILLAATAAVAAGAYFAVSSRSTGGGDAARAALFDLSSRRQNEVASIAVKGKEKAATIKGTGTEWKVEELGGYPAKFENVKKAITGVATLTKIEPKTANPSLYAKIGVQDPGPDSDSTLVTLTDNAGAAVASLIVGKGAPGSAKPSTYVRVPGQAQSWLVEGSVSAPADPLDWVEREVMTLDTTRLHSVVIDHPDGDRVEIVRGEAPGTWSVRGIPEGRKLQYDTIGATVANALSWTSLTDVKAAEGFEWDEAQAVAAEYRTNDGLVVKVSTVDVDGKYWAKFLASAAAPRAGQEPAGTDEDAEAPGGAVRGGDSSSPQPPDQPATEPNAEDAAAKAAEEARRAADEAAAQAKADAERIAKEAADLNARLSPWVFAFDASKAAQFRKRMDDLLSAQDPPPTPQPVELETPAQPAPFEFPGQQGPPPRH